jgi:hypothetical protein
MISAALNTFTVSPSLMSLELIYSALLSVAAETIEPEILTGFKLAT